MGDSTYMTYRTRDNFDIIHDTGSFHDHYILSSNVNDHQFATVKQVCESEQPPHAKTMHEVTENCQGWTLRVLRRLVQAGVITEAKYEMAAQMQEPLKK